MIEHAARGRMHRDGANGGLARTCDNPETNGSARRRIAPSFNESSQTLALPGRAAEFRAPRHDGEAAAGELVHFLADRGAQVGGQRGGGVLE